MSATTHWVVSFCAVILFFNSASVQATHSSNATSKPSLKSNATTNNNTVGRKEPHVDEEWGGGAGEWVDEGDEYIDQDDVGLDEYIDQDVPVKPRPPTCPKCPVCPRCPVCPVDGDDSDYDRKEPDFDRKEKE